jgi:transcriptional regulator with XRE-family HTH domain
MSELLAMLDDYRDKHGQPSDASIARAAGIHRQRISLWRTEGVRSMPDPDTLRGLARVLHVSEETVVLAAARDAGYLRPRGSDEGEHEAPTMRDHG